MMFLAVRMLLITMILKTQKQPNIKANFLNPSSNGKIFSHIVPGLKPKSLI